MPLSGDDFIGTEWDRRYHYNGSQAAHFMNILKPNAMTVGNHEVGRVIRRCDNGQLAFVT